MLSADTDVSRDSRVEVDDAAVRRGLSLWLEGALTFRTSKQVKRVIFICDAACFHTQIWLISECSPPSTPSPEEYSVSRDHLLAGCTIVQG